MKSGLPHSAVLYVLSWQDGTELFPLPPEVAQAGFPQVRTFSGGEYEDLLALQALDWRNFEGFVVRFDDGGRLKVDSHPQ